MRSPKVFAKAAEGSPSFPKHVGVPGGRLLLASLPHYMARCIEGCWMPPSRQPLALGTMLTLISLR